MDNESPRYVVLRDGLGFRALMVTPRRLGHREDLVLYAPVGEYGSSPSVLDRIEAMEQADEIAKTIPAIKRVPSEQANDIDGMLDNARFFFAHGELEAAERAIRQVHAALRMFRMEHAGVLDIDAGEVL